MLGAGFCSVPFKSAPGCGSWSSGRAGELLQGLGCAWPPAPSPTLPVLPVGMPIPGFGACPAAWGAQEPLGVDVLWGWGPAFLPPRPPGLGHCWAAQCHSLCPQVLRGVPAALPASTVPTLPALPHALRPQEGGEGFQCGETAFVLQGSLQGLQQEGKAHRGRLPVPVPLPVLQPWHRGRKVAC